MTLPHYTKYAFNRRIVKEKLKNEKFKVEAENEIGKVYRIINSKIQNPKSKIQNLKSKI